MQTALDAELKEVEKQDKSGGSSTNFQGHIFKEGKLLHKTKRDYFFQKMEKCGILNLSKSLIVKQQEPILASSSSNNELAKFFINKSQRSKMG